MGWYRGIFLQNDTIFKKDRLNRQRNKFQKETNENLFKNYKDIKQIGPGKSFSAVAIIKKRPKKSSA